MIHVKPINDPPTIVPLWPSASAGGENVCDENTNTFPVVAFFRFKFNGRDIDNKCPEIKAQILNFLDKFVGNVYVCGPEHQGHNARGSYNCSDGRLLTSVEFIEPYEPAHFELSIIPYPHWNGIIELDLVIWDPELPSYPANFKLRVRPINDYPTVVAGATSAGVEYYKKELSGREITYTPIDHQGDTASFTITERNSQEFRDIGGEVLGDREGTATAATQQELEEGNNLQPGELQVAYRLRTKVQDRDFFFGYHLNMSAALIHGFWIPSLGNNGNSATKRNEQGDELSICKFTSSSIFTCRAEINDLNAYLLNVGLVLAVDDDSESAVGLFLLNDTGSIDWLDRPLAGGFIIEFFKPDEDEVLAAPIAAVVILPVIAAATAAAIAAAWIALGQRASDYAGASFDAFAVSTGQGGNASPLYDAKGLEVTSALYNDGVNHG
jgi:hypothetical protein